MAIHLSTLMSIIVTLSTITIITKEIPLTVLITMSIKEISILLVKVVLAHQHHRLVVDQELRPPTGRQQSLQHTSGRTKSGASTSNRASSSNRASLSANRPSTSQAKRSSSPSSSNSLFCI